jgi:hypothetical protein
MIIDSRREKRRKKSGSCGKQSGFLSVRTEPPPEPEREKKEHRISADAAEAAVQDPLILNTPVWTKASQAIVHARIPIPAKEDAAPALSAIWTDEEMSMRFRS